MIEMYESNEETLLPQREKPKKSYTSYVRICCVWVLVTSAVVALTSSAVMFYFVTKYSSNKVPAFNEASFREANEKSLLNVLRGSKPNEQSLLDVLRGSNTSQRSSFGAKNAFAGLENGNINFRKVERNDAQLCNSDELKKTFPDFDYATFGYNIIYGYPMANGHDPGLTHPVFAADYSDLYHSADCQYHVPKGYHLIPDVSCVTSFTSQTTKDSRQLSKSLSVSVEVSGGGWGLSFSASSQYKKTSSSMAESESVFVMSTAKCSYYVAVMDEKNPPPFSKSFIETVKKMKTLNDTYDFFAYYGTHYLTYTLFGARFVYKYKMSKDTFQSESKSSMSVSVKASYAGAFSLGGGFGMDKSHSEAAKHFLENVETETISIGAPPPANGNTMVWASTVKETPIPVEYKMISIEDLFTPSFFQGTGIEYKEKRKLIVKGKDKYCEYLRANGKVNSCVKQEQFLIFNRIWLKRGYNKYMRVEKIQLQECLERCLNNFFCITVHHYPDINQKGEYVCVLYKTKKTQNSEGTMLKTLARKGLVNSVVYVLPNALRYLNASLKLENSKFDTDIPTRNRNVTKTEETCRKICVEDSFCSIYTFYVAAKRGDYNCWTYDKKQVSCSHVLEATHRSKRSTTSTNDCNLLNPVKSYNTVFLP